MKRKTVDPVSRKRAKQVPPRSKVPARRAVRVRVYRLGFGECALLTFPKGPRGQFNVLIDCGEGTRMDPDGPGSQIGEVVADIATATREKLDLIIITNQQSDHVSGFLRERGQFDAIEIGKVWVAWAEDPADELAKRHRSGRDDRLEAIRLGLKLGGAKDCDPQLLGVGGAPMREALDYIISRAKAGIEYLSPGERRSWSGVTGVSTYVLGPPKSAALLSRSAPYQGEVYAGDSLAIGSSGGRSADGGAGGEPFDSRFRVELAEAQERGFFRDHFGFPGCAGDGALGWRRIDGGGQPAVALLASKLEGETNNTSLALAFELEGSGKVLLFPSDAQVGSWTSWANLRLQNASGDPLRGHDLLARTVLFKVGQYGSETATPKDGGLELMTSSGLVAVLAADREAAAQRHWPLPAKPLYDRLREMARGRVLATDCDTLPPPEETVLDADDRAAFEKAHRVTRLFIECLIPVPV